MQRWLKFAKYLPEFGWQPIIITPEKGTAPYYDDGLLKDVPPEAEIIRTGTLEPFALYNALQGKKKTEPIPVGMIGLTEKKGGFHRLAAYLRANLFVPDGRVGWVPFAEKAALKRIAQGDIDVLVTTGPPHSTHLAGLAVAQKTGIPWLADLRDPWTNVYYNQQLPRSARTKARDLALETSVLNAATAITVVSPGMADEFGPRAKRTEVIYNGYDAEDIPENRPTPYPDFSLSHIGNFFPSMESTGLVEALARLLKEEPGFADDFKMRFTGLLDPQVHNRFIEAGLGNHIVVNKPVPHAEAVLEMMRASVLLFSIPAEGNVRAMVTGKIFEYLATGLPILALGDANSGAGEVLEQAGQEKMSLHGDGVRIFEKLQKLYQAWRANNNTPNTGISTDIEGFSRKNCTRKLAVILGELAG